MLPSSNKRAFCAFNISSVCVDSKAERQNSLYICLTDIHWQDLMHLKHDFMAPELFVHQASFLPHKMIGIIIGITLEPLVVTP